MDFLYKARDFVLYFLGYGYNGSVFLTYFLCHSHVDIVALYVLKKLTVKLHILAEILESVRNKK